MRILNFRVLQGLGNRLRGLLSAIGAAEATRRELFVTWEQTPVCGARIGDLWEHDLHLNGWATARALHIASGGRHPNMLAGTYPVVSMSAGWSFAPELQPRPAVENYRQLRLRSDLQSRVDAVVDRIGNRPVIGVAIRAHRQHAHPKSLKASPPDWYERRIGEIVQQYPGIAVFVSSDDPDLARRWEQRWNGYVVTLPGKGTYATVHGLQDALCDLHLLAGCAYIVGAHASSLSEVAGMLQGRGAFETSQNPPTVGIESAIAVAPRWRWPRN